MTGTNGYRYSNETSGAQGESHNGSALPHWKIEMPAQVTPARRQQAIDEIAATRPKCALR